MAIYVVRSGDSLESIADTYGIDPLALAYDNQIPYPYALAVGAALWVSDTFDENESDRPGISDGEDGGEIENVAQELSIQVGGYAYPFISRFVLEQTLPYLTDLLIFSYGFTAEGDLVYPILSDDWMISLAKQYGAAPILTLTPFGPDGRFNNYLISQIVSRQESRENLIRQITDQIENRGFEGVDIDFEYILAEDRDGFTSFVQEVADAVHALGYPVSVALAPKTSASQTGLLYQGKDYPALGAAADYVLLMTYEWGYTYGPPMAVAPINNVRQVVDYAVTEIPPSKIHLGIPNYGYDWTLPYVQGESRAVTLGSIEARQIAVREGVNIEYDETAKSPYFRYMEGPRQHEVWFEDIRSMEAKFSLIREYGLRGAGYWNIMNLFRANWLGLREYFYV